MFELIFTALAAAGALIVAGLWIKASYAEVPAPAETSGVGGLIGGYLIGVNPKGERIDLIGTVQEQSHWNSRAACWSAFPAVCGFCAAVAHVLEK